MSAGKPMVLRNRSTNDQIKIYNIADLQAIPGFSNISSLIQCTNTGNQQGVDAVVFVSQCRTFMLNSFEVLKETDAHYDKNEYEAGDKKLADLRSKAAEKKARLDEISDKKILSGHPQAEEDLTDVKRFMVDILDTQKERNTLDIKAMICIFDNSSILDSFERDLVQIDQGGLPYGEGTFIRLQDKIRLLDIEFSKLKQACAKKPEEKLSKRIQETVDNIGIATKTLKVSIKMREGFYFTKCATGSINAPDFIDKALQSFASCLDLKNKHPLPEEALSQQNYFNILVQMVSFCSQKRVAYDRFMKKNKLNAAQRKDLEDINKEIKKRTDEMLAFPQAFASAIAIRFTIGNVFFTTGDLDNAIKEYENIRQNLFTSKKEGDADDVNLRNAIQKIICGLREKQGQDTKIRKELEELLMLKVSPEEGLRSKLFAADLYVQLNDLEVASKLSNNMLSDLAVSNQFKSSAMKFTMAATVNAFAAKVMILSLKDKKPDINTVERISDLNKIAFGNICNVFSGSVVNGELEFAYVKESLNICLNNYTSIAKMYNDIAKKTKSIEEKEKCLLAIKDIFCTQGAIYSDDRKKFPAKNNQSSGLRKFLNDTYDSKDLVKSANQAELEIEFINNELKGLYVEKRKHKKQIEQDEKNAEAKKALAAKSSAEEEKICDS
jgi:hypothetical protein